MNTPPRWVGYVGLNDVDATTERFRAAGGSVYVEPRDIPNVGRFAVVTDPQKATIALFKPGARHPRAPSRRPRHPLASVGTSYSRPIGRKRSPSTAACSAGRRARRMTWARWAPISFSTPAARRSVACLTNRRSCPATFWIYYLNVDAVEPAAERVKAGGGQIAKGPMEEPGDPQGATFAALGLAASRSVDGARHVWR
jgi:uncharacterized protein